MGKEKNTVTVNWLHKQLGKLIDKGNGRCRICVDKDSFHSFEGSGVSVLQVAGMEVEMIHNSDGDGGIKVNKDGSESYSRLCVLYGDYGWPKQSAEMKGARRP